MNFSVIDPDNTRDIRPQVLDASGRLKLVSVNWWAQRTAAERGLFGHLTGRYHFPTLELVDVLRRHIGERRAIEVCAGTGDLCGALGIDGYDNRMQEWPSIAMQYKTMGQPTIPYGKHVIEGDANAAVVAIRPDVVVAAWMTHRYHSQRHALGGNQHGPDHKAILRNCGELIFIGNTHTHAHHPLLKLPHRVLDQKVFSRAQSGQDFVAIFPRLRV